LAAAGLHAAPVAVLAGLLSERSSSRSDSRWRSSRGRSSAGSRGLSRARSPRTKSSTLLRAARFFITSASPAPGLAPGAAGVKLLNTRANALAGSPSGPSGWLLPRYEIRLRLLTPRMPTPISSVFSRVFTPHLPAMYWSIEMLLP
jgi:hypothetical protein